MQISADTFIIKHPCLIAPEKNIRIGEDLFIVFSSLTDPLVYPARLIELYEERNLLYLILWNYRTSTIQKYFLDLRKSDCLFMFISMSFIYKLSKIMTDKSNPEAYLINKQNIHYQD